jgi:hypothetical protein
MRNPDAVAVIVVACFVWTASADASHRGIDPLTQSNGGTRTVIVMKPLSGGPLLQIENLRLVSPPPKAPHPSALLKFDMLNDTALRLTDVVVRVSFLERRADDANALPPRIVVGPVTVRVDETLQAGYVLSYEMLFRNLSTNCDCAPRVEILSARLLPD